MEENGLMELNDELAEAEEDSRQGKYMTFGLGTDTFGIELKYVSEIIQMQQIAPIPEVEPFIRGLINLRGKIVPVIDTAERLGKQPFEYTDRTCIIVIEVQGLVVGLITERISEVVSIEEDDILPPPNTSKGYTNGKFIKGIGKMGDTVKLLLDPVKLITDNELDLEESPEDDEGE